MSEAVPSGRFEGGLLAVPPAGVQGAELPLGVWVEAPQKLEEY